MTALVWVQALTLGASLAALGWALTSGPLRIAQRASADFLVFNVLTALGALVWWVMPVDRFLSAEYVLAVGASLAVVGFQWMCRGLHRLYDVKPSYVVSPFMLPAWVALLGVTAWMDSSGTSVVLVSFSLSVWALGVTVQQGFAAMSAQSGAAAAKAALLPCALAAVLWLLGMASGVWRLVVGDDQPGGSAAGLLAVSDVLIWLVGWALVNGGLLSLVMLKLVGRIRDLSTEDDLTGAMNLRTLMALLRDERERIRRVPLPQTLLVCELDQHEALTRQLGFAAGDAALRHLTQVMGRGLRKTDRLAASGQGELLLFLTNTPAVGATLVAERTQAAVKANPFLWRGQAIHLSLSIGISSRDTGALDDDTLMELATQAARRARREGGGRIRLASVDTGAPDSRFANTGAPPVEQLGQATP